MTARFHRPHPLLAPKASFGLRLLCCTALVAVAVPAYAQTALPTGGQYVAGSGSIGTVGSTTTINQSSTRGIINWNSFSIGAGGVVNFNNGSGATLNRVTGGNLSQIDGQLNATGSVYLINPNGVVVGAGGKVVTNGSFVASTRDMGDDDFMQGTDHFTGTGNGDVINLGTINSKTGDVALIGHGVVNHGDIDAHNGIAVLAAGNDVYLHPVDGAHGLYIKPQSAKGGDVTTDGQVKAAAVAIEAAQGNVYALAGNHGGLIEATGTTTKDGQVWLMADNGTTDVGGALHAQNADGTGGSIETSGHSVHFEPTAQIATGLGGSWLIDPDNLTIDATAASILSSALNGGTSITEQTTFTGGGIIGNTGSGDGDIDVNSAISWSSSATLTLDAFHSVNINAPVTISGGGGLVVNTNNNNGGTSTGDGVLNVDMAGGASVQFTGGAGTLSINGNAYTLLYDMDDMQNMVGGSTHYSALAVPIDASTYVGFTPISAGTVNFDGLGNTITGLQITSSAVQNVALWGDLTGGFVQNFGLVGGKVTNTYSAGPTASTASLIGVSYINIRNVFSTMDVESDNGSSTHAYTGGLVGMVSAGDLTDVYATGSVTSDNASGDRIGGLVGALGATSPSTITNAWASGDVTSASSAFIGGLLGYLYDSSSVDTVYATGTVTENGTAGGVGGLIGYIPGNSSVVTNAYATGDVIDNGGGSGSSVGGLIGDDHATTSNVYATGNVISSNNSGGRIGGLVGASGATVTNAYATGNVTVSDDTDTGTTFTGIGGLVGYQNSLGTITQSYASGKVTVSNGPHDNTGGLIGVADSGSTVTQAYATGDVLCNSCANAGGLAGATNANATITDDHATGAVENDGAATLTSNHTGGLAGINYTTISNSYATGDVIGKNTYGAKMGGLVGENVNTASNVDHTYATGSVEDDDNTTLVAYVGGLVGSNSGNITNSYTKTGTVTLKDIDPTTVSTGYGFIGGLTGYNQPSGTIDTSHAGMDVMDSGSSNTRAGGFAGANSSTITNSYATGNVTGDQDQSIGGLIGYNYTNGVADTDYATGNITASGAGTTELLVGGLVGYNSLTAVVENAYATGDIVVTSGRPLGGGLVGRNSGVVTGSYATGSISDHNTATDSFLGGLVGYADSNANSVVDTSYATGNVTDVDSSGSYLGGLVGDSHAPITNSYATGTVYGEDEIGMGGLVGFLGADTTAVINNCYATGNVTNEALVRTNYIGGLVGDAQGTVTNAYATGDVTVTGNTGVASYMGGLLGYLYSTNGQVTNAYATGDVVHQGVSTNTRLGGLIGLDTTANDVTNVYATGKIIPNNTNNAGYIGGLMGSNGGNALIVNGYWLLADNTPVGVGAGPSAGATGLTAAQWFTENPVDTGAFSSADWVLGYPYPVLKALPYIKATASGTLAQGSTAISATTTSAVDQNGDNAAGKISNINWVSNANGGSTVGSYKLGETGAVASGYQVAYTGTLTVTAPNKNVTGTGTVPLPPVAPAGGGAASTSLQSSSNGLAPLPMLINVAVYSPDETLDINLSRGLAVYASPTQALTSGWLAHRFGIKLDIASGYIVLSR